MKEIKVLYVVLFFFCNGLWSQAKQEAVNHIRQGNKLFAAEKFAEAEIAYRKALEKDPQSKEAIYNLGTAQYQQKKFEDAVQSFNKTTTSFNVDKVMQASVYHNLGNAYLMNKKTDEAIKAYKEALKRNPKDLDTKHNLLLAMREKQQQQQQQKQDQNKQSNQNKDKKDQDKDGKGDNQDDQKGKGKEDENKDGSKGGEGNKGDKDSDKNGDQDGGKEAQERKGQMSQAQAEKLLEALQNEEKKAQSKMLLLKGKPKPVKTEKDW